MLKYHEFTNWMFDNENPDIEIKSQLPLYAYINDIEYKVLVDHIIINNKLNTVIPIDLKVSSSQNFYIDFVKYRYYIQSALYSDVIQKNYPGYNITPFEFVVARRNNTNNPLRYVCTQNDLRVGRDGGQLRSGRRIKGYKQLTSEYSWHLENDLWDDPKEVYDEKGVFKLNAFDLIEQNSFANVEF